VRFRADTRRKITFDDDEHKSPRTATRCNTAAKADVCWVQRRLPEIQSASRRKQVAHGLMQTATPSSEEYADEETATESGDATKGGKSK